MRWTSAVQFLLLELTLNIWRLRSVANRWHTPSSAKIQNKSSLLTGVGGKTFSWIQNASSWVSMTTDVMHVKPNLLVVNVLSQKVIQNDTATLAWYKFPWKSMTIRKIMSQCGEGKRGLVTVCTNCFHRIADSFSILIVISVSFRPEMQLPQLPWSVGVVACDYVSQTNAGLEIS